MKAKQLYAHNDLQKDNICVGEALVGGSELQCVLPLGLEGRVWPWQRRTRVMGILNVTPDSFSDGGLSCQRPEASLAQAKVLVRQGADILDIGGQSTRPGANLVSAEEESSRILPILRCIQRA